MFEKKSLCNKLFNSVKQCTVNDKIILILYINSLGLSVSDRAWEGVLCSREFSVIGKTVAADFE